MKYLAFKDRYYSKIMQSSSISDFKTHFRLNKKSALCTSSTPKKVKLYFLYQSVQSILYVFCLGSFFFFFTNKPQDPVLPPIWKPLLYFAIACTIESFSIKPWMYEKVILIRINFDFLLTWNHAIRFHSHTATKSTAAYFAVLAIYCKHTHTHTHKSWEMPGAFCNALHRSAHAH